jgi:hypothetical protein
MKHRNLWKLRGNLAPYGTVCFLASAVHRAYSGIAWVRGYSTLHTLVRQRTADGGGPPPTGGADTTPTAIPIILFNDINIKGGIAGTAPPAPLEEITCGLQAVGEALDAAAADAMTVKISNDRPPFMPRILPLESRESMRVPSKASGA